MRKLLVLFTLLIVLGLAACGNGNETEETDELAILEVDFIVPETAEPGDTVILEAVVTYGGEPVEDADEVVFEYWHKGNEKDSAEVEGTHMANGSYKAEVEFPQDGEYEIYAHTTARGLHTMPLTSIIVGEGGVAEVSEHVHGEHGGFHLHFMEPGAVNAGTELDLIVHLQMEGETFENATVRYEIALEENPEKTEWIDAVETVAGEYVSSHEFLEAGTYKLVIHVEGEADLHEHEEFRIEVE